MGTYRPDRQTSTGNGSASTGANSASVLGPGNDDATAYAQADAVLDVLQQQVLAAIRECAAPGMELRYDGTEDRYAAAYVAGVQTAHAAAEAILRGAQ